MILRIFRTTDIHRLIHINYLFPSVSICGLIFSNFDFYTLVSSLTLEHFLLVLGEICEDNSLYTNNRA
jgi:hypothetical protein